MTQQLNGGIVSPPPPPPPQPSENLPSHLSGGEGEASDSKGDGDGSKTAVDPTQVSESDKKFSVDAMTEALGAITGGDGIIDGHPKMKPPPAPTDVRVELDKSRGARVPAWAKHTAAPDAPPDKGGKPCPNGEAFVARVFNTRSSEWVFD